MPGNQAKEVIHTRIWQEEAEPDNPFATRLARCHGFDVYGDMLGDARWVEMVYLLFRSQPPSASAAQLMESLAVALANPGPRDPSVHAAMCGGTGGSPAAASLMAALAVGAGSFAGGREILLAVQDWRDCGTDLKAWRDRLCNRPANNKVSTWPDAEHPPGFDPHGVRTTLIVEQALSRLGSLGVGEKLSWLKQYRTDLEDAAGMPLSLTGVAAAAFADLGFASEEAEMLYLILRLPGAAAHALEQWKFGHKKFPFYRNEFETDRPTPTEAITA
jgi:citrate synthase